MSRPAIFFDRDNTLIVNDGYLGDPAGVVLVAGAPDAIARARALGYAAVTFSNQSGVARGMYSEEAVHAVNAKLDELLQDQNPRAVIDRHEFCPFHPDGVVEEYAKESELRKPKPGMLKQAAQRLGLDLSRSWVIGDAPRDMQAGKAAGCRTILFRDPALQLSAAAVEETAVPPDFTATSLREALEIVERHPMPKSFDTTSTEPAAPAPPASSTPAETSPPDRPMTFAERVKAGKFQPTISETRAEAAERPRRGLPAGAEKALQRPEAAPAEETPAAPPPAPPTPAPVEVPADSKQVTALLHQIHEELRLLRHKTPHMEFSVTKLLAGIVQVLVFPALFFAYLHRDVAQDFQSLLILALVLQVMTIALLIMGRQS